MKIEWKCDQPAQIKRGIEPTETASVDVVLADLSPEQRELLADGWQAKLVEATPEEVSELLAAEVAKRAEAKAAADKRGEEYRAACQSAEIVETGRFGETWTSGVKIQWPLVGVTPDKVRNRPPVGYYGTTDEDRACVAVWDEIVAPLAAEASRRNDEAKRLAIEAAAPLVDAAKAKAALEAEAKKEAEAAALRAKLARRAETQTVEVEISRGGREWGTPWGAVVTAERGKDVYNFDVASYDLATETVTIRCQPGDVIAWGQKHFNKPRRTIHERRRVSEDWRLVSL